MKKIWKQFLNFLFKGPKKEQEKTPIQKPEQEKKQPEKVAEPQPATKYEKILGIAVAEVGVSEISGSKHNKRILEYHAATDGKFSEDEIPWCSSFVSWVLEQAGIKSTKSAWARSYLNWGIELKEPVKGCVVVFSRGNDKTKGHVAFFHKKESGMIYVVGGNQGNKVSVQSYPEWRLLSYRGLKES